MRINFTQNVGRGRLYRMLPVCLLMLCFLNAAAQQLISGRITDPSLGNGLQGVNVQVKGTTAATMSDAEGNYTIEAKPGDILEFSLAGYTMQEMPVGNSTRIDVGLEEDISSLAALLDVVLVGYGELKRIDLSSAQSSIDVDAINYTFNTTIEQALQGRAAGVYVTQNSGQPGGSVSVNIRGINSVNGSNEPLYVIDGVQIAPGTVPFGATSSADPLAGINPADIDNIEVLQGPSATAIYGSRGTNGVILITTKRGKAGEVKVHYGFQYGLQNTPKQLPVLNLREYAQLRLDQNAMDGIASPVAFQDPAALGTGTNWQKELYKTAPLMKHQLSLSGGREETTFYLSGEYLNQNGIITGSGFDRGSLRLNIDNQTRKWLKLGATLNVSQTDDKLTATNENVVLNALRIAPNVAVKNLDGSWGGADAINEDNVQFTPPNPVAISNLIQNKYRRRQMLGGVNADIDLGKGFTFTTSVNGNFGTGNSVYFMPMYTLGEQTNEVASLTSTDVTSTYWNWNQLLKYTRNFGVHELSIMASHEAQVAQAKTLSGTRVGFVTSNVLDLNVGDSGASTNDSHQSVWAMESYFSRVNYIFNKKYLVQLAMRADGSSNFGAGNRWGIFPSGSAAWRISEEPFMKSIPTISELKLRAEAGVTGNQGNGGTYTPMSPVSSPWGSGFITSQYGNNTLKWEQTTTYNVGFNLGLLSDRIHIEGDFYIKKTNNLLMTNPIPDYMGTTGNGSIIAPTENISALENRGYSFTVNTVNMDQQGFTWKTGFNISGFRTKITKLYSNSAIVDRVSWYMNNFTQRAVVGQSPWQFYGYQEEGIFQSVADINASAVPLGTDGNRLPAATNGVWVGDTKFKDVNGDGVINEKDRTFIGNPFPKFFFGMTNTFTYKGFDLNVFITGSYGNDIYNYARYAGSNQANVNLGLNVFREDLNYARIGTDTEGNPYVENAGTNIPRLSTNANGNNIRITNRFVEDGSYVRLKNVQLGYTIPKALIARQRFVNDIHVAIGAQNLATLTHYKGYDPEVGAYVGSNVAAGNQAIGVDYGRYPLTPVYTFSIQVEL
ncbi:MAG TPA: TonB-dependent receptor [Ohtaekwangia sp.]|uniref:SusC/RagA family TonB-linked outer membrane protein n=1 Tax=Ohtaekwangia sp. TaxID=2066019 RepID=UPI002F95CEC7